MKLKYQSLLLLLMLACWVVSTDTQVNATISCASCTSYVMTIGNSTAGAPINCPTGTVCSVSNTATSVCAATNPCDGVVCDRYAVFPSSSSCRQYHVCRYVKGYAAFVVTTYTCPGTSKFDMNTRKCTLSPALCYNDTDVIS